MLGFTNDEIYSMVIEVASLLPLEYQSGHLDVYTSDCISDMLTDHKATICVDAMVLSDVVEAQWAVLEDNLVQVAMDIRLELPSHIACLQMIMVTDYVVTCRALTVQ